MEIKTFPPLSPPPNLSLAFYFSYPLIFFSYLFDLRGFVWLDIGVIIDRDFRSTRRWCWPAVIYIRVCEVEREHVLGVFDWRVVISGRQRHKHHAILEVAFWNAPDGVFDPKMARFAIHHGFGDRVEFFWFTVALFKSADGNEDWVIHELVEKENTTEIQNSTCHSNMSSFTRLREVRVG